MEHSQRLLELCKKLPTPKNSMSLAVPLSIRILKKCIQYQIDFEFTKRLHFYDLQCLIIQLEIQDIQQYLKGQEDQKLSKKGIKEIKDISGNEAIKFLGR